MKNILILLLLKKLSKLVAINEFKLKSGFTHLFNTTPYAIVREYRMLSAKDLLHNSGLNINQIASEIGYKKSMGTFRKYILIILQYYQKM